MKVSNIPIAGLETGLHGNHRAIERRLAASQLRGDDPAAVVLLERDRQAGRRASRAASSCCRPARARSRGSIRPTSPRSRPRRSSRDDLDGPLHLTGPEALDGDEVAARLGVTPRSTSRSTAGATTVVAAGLDPWLADSTVHLYEAVAAARSPSDDRHRRARARPAAAPLDDWFVDELVPLLAGRRADEQRVRGDVADCRDRRRVVAGYGGQPGSPVRANAAHAVAHRAPTARGRRRRDRRTRPSRRRSCRTGTGCRCRGTRRRSGPSHVKQYVNVGPCGACASSTARHGTCISLSPNTARQISFVSSVPSARS